MVAFIDQMIEHRAAVLLLIRSGMVGSAFALVRSIFESLYRGAWILICATDAELAKFEKKDDLPLTLGAMADAIDAKVDLGGFFADLKTRGWKALNSYTHTGLLQLGRRFTGHKLQPKYSDVEISEVTTMATTCILLLVRPFFGAHKHQDEAEQIDALLQSYGPAKVKRQAKSCGGPRALSGQIHRAPLFSACRKPLAAVLATFIRAMQCGSRGG